MYSDSDSDQKKPSSKGRFNPAHGGALDAAVNYFNIPLESWLDLSTGINPTGWPVPEIPQSAWQRLPEQDSGLESVALDYYLDGTTANSDEPDKENGSKNEKNVSELTLPTVENILPCSGSQQAIRLLPHLYGVLKKNTKSTVKIQNEVKVWVTSGSYSEHASAWEDQGYRVREVPCDRLTQLLAQQPVDVLILVNPDNPSGHKWSKEQLLKWWSILQSRGGWLIVDEAFMDMSPDQSLVPYLKSEGLFVLRSVGKFFGLAGMRLGFLFSSAKNIRCAQNILGPWVVGHPTQFIGKLALQDHSWIKQQRESLNTQSQRLQELLEQGFSDLPVKIVCTDLFCTVYVDEAELVFNALAKQGVLTRCLFVQSSALKSSSATSSIINAAVMRKIPAIRFGLPGTSEVDWQRLDNALTIALSVYEK